jgi:hypothetical protein
MEKSEYRVEKKLAEYNRELSYRKKVYWLAQTKAVELAALKAGIFEEKFVLAVPRENILGSFAVGAGLVLATRSLAVFPISGLGFYLYFVYKNLASLQILGKEAGG